MKYPVKKYAKALAEAILNQKNDRKKIAANFLKLLQKNGDVKKAARILSAAESLLLKAKGNKKVRLETARSVDTKSLQKSFVKEGDLVEEKISPALVAGVKVIIDDSRQLDMSFKRKLENIF